MAHLPVLAAFTACIWLGACGKSKSHLDLYDAAPAAHADYDSYYTLPTGSRCSSINMSPDCNTGL